MGLYYNPEDYGLTVIGEAFYSDYSWDGVVVWRHEDGRILAGHDSVCSCYSPFEGKGVEDLVHVTRVAQVDALLDLTYDVDASEKADLLKKVREAL